MAKMGIDVHKVATQVCISTDEGEFVEFRIRTERDALTKAFGSRARARILLEAATESEWVARMRNLLVECAWGVVRRLHPSTRALREWALSIAARRAKRIAAVALVRRLAAIPFAMTRHGRDFKPERLERSSKVASAA